MSFTPFSRASGLGLGRALTTLAVWYDHSRVTITKIIEKTQFVDEVIGYLADEDWKRAAAELRSEYESVCETSNPELTDDNQPAACHLYEGNSG